MKILILVVVNLCVNRRSMVSAIACWLGTASLASVPSEMRTAKGEFTVTYYKGSDHTKEVVDGIEQYVGKVAVIRQGNGIFEVSSDTQMFQVRVLSQNDRMTKRMLLTSDYKAVYYSQILEGQGVTVGKPGAQIKAQPIAWGAFEHGVMPNNMSFWEEGQVLTVSFLLASNHHVISSHTLPPEMIPGSLVTQLKNNLEPKSPASLRAHVERSTGMHTVNFWAIKGDSKVSELRNGPDCWLIAKLEVSSDPASILKSVTYFRNHLFFTKLGFSGSEPHVSMRFDVKGVGLGAPDRFKDIAYDSDVPASVNDRRFGKQGGYRLGAGEPPPFEATNTYKKTADMMHRREERAASDERKGKIVSWLCALSIIPLWLALRAGHISETVTQSAKT